MKKSVLLFAIILCVSSCGPKLIYPNLDWLIPWYVGDYISLDRDQRTLLENRLVHILSWHCQTQLPDYADTLRKLARDLSSPNHPVDERRLSSYYEIFMDYWKKLITHLGPDVRDILMTASDEQLEELFSNLEKRNQEMKAEYVDLATESLNAKRQERMVKRLEQWLSRLTPEQEQAVADWSRQLKPIASEWLQNRQLMTDEFRLLMRKRQSSPTFRTEFMERLVYPEHMRAEVFQTKIDYNTQVTLRFLVKLNQLLTEGQRAYLGDKLQSLAKDFEELSCGAGPS